MSSFKTYIPQFKKGIDNLLEDKFIVIGAQAVTWAQDELNRLVYEPYDPASANYELTNTLLNTISWVTRKSMSSNNKMENPTELGVKIGCILAYLARIEFGFNGQDSLGRTYKQKAKAFLSVIPILMGMMKTVTL